MVMYAQRGKESLNWQCEISWQCELHRNLELLCVRVSCVWQGGAPTLLEKVTNKDNQPEKLACTADNAPGIVIIP